MPTINTIRFKELRNGQDREIGSIKLQDDGVIVFAGIPPHIEKALKENGAIGPGRKRFTIADGRKFLIACLFQFSGGYIRAVPEKRDMRFTGDVKGLSATITRAVDLALGRIDPSLSESKRTVIERDARGQIAAIVEERTGGTIRKRIERDAAGNIIAISKEGDSK
jgi:hypothetical protein